MAKQNEHNPFDEQSTNTSKKESKPKPPKFDIKAFKALPIEEQVRIAKEQMNSESGFAHPYILDIYNKEVLKEETLTGKTKNYTKPKKPKISSAVEKTNKPSTEIKDLSQLSETIEQFPEATAQIESSEIPKIQAQVTIIEEGINQNTENALNKAEALGGEEGKQTMQDSLNEVAEEKVEIITTAEKEVEEVIRNDETVKPLEIIDQGHAKKNEIENSMNALRNEINDIEKMISEIEENSQGVLTDETKTKLKEAFELKGGMQNKLSKLTNELNALNENPSVAGESSAAEQPTKTELTNKMTELTALQASLAGKIASTEKTLAEKDAEILNIEEGNPELIQRSKYIQDLADSLFGGDFEKAKAHYENNVKGLAAKIEEENLSSEESEERLKPLSLESETTQEHKNELVLSTLENNQTEKGKGWLAKSKESLKNAYGKGMEWLGKQDETTKGRWAKTILSGAFIASALYVTGDAAKLLPQNSSFTGKVTSRVFGSALAMSLMNSNIAQKAKNSFSDLTPKQKVILGACIVVVGAGGVTYLAGVAALGKIGVSMGIGMGLRAGSNKVFNLNEKIAKATEETKPKIEELNEKIKQLEKEKININDKQFFEELSKLEADRNLINKELRKLRAFKTIEGSVISFASGLAYMGVDKLSQSETVQQFIKKPFLSNLWNQVKNLRSSNEAAALTTGAKTGGLPQEITPNAEVVDTNNTGSTPETTSVPKPEQNTLPETNEQLAKTSSVPEKITGNKMDIKDIKSEAIIDGKDRVGITYAFRDQIKANPELLKSLKSLNIDETRLDDAKYMAQVTKDIAIKTGYMDTEGREIRINKEYVDKIAYVLAVNEEGKIEVREVDTKTGEIYETHCEGDSFEGKAKNIYETLKEKASRVSGIVSPERISGDPTYVTDDFADLNNNGISDYIERPDGEITPDSLSDDEIEAPEKIIKIEDTKLYTYDNIKDSKNWDILKDTQVREIFRKGEINMIGEESKIAKSLLAFEKDILNKIDNKEEFEKFIRENGTMTARERVLFYREVKLAGDFTEELKDRYEYYDKVPQISENSNSNLAQMQRIAKDEFKKYFRTENELKSITDTYTKNINKLTYGASNQWLEVKDQGALKYMKNNDNYLSSYLKTLQNETGLKPKSNLFRREEIEEYIMRATMKAKILDKSAYIIPHTVVREDYNDGMTPAKSGAPSEKPDAIYQQYLEDINK